MGTLRSELEQLATNFVSQVLEAMRAASLSDLAEQSSPSASRSTSGTGGRGRGRTRQAAAAPAAESAAPRARGAGGRRKRATPDEVAKQKDQALAAAKALKPGFSKSDVMQKAGSKIDLGRALSLLVTEGKLIKKGDRRMTRYWAK